MAEYIDRGALLAFLEENHTDRDWLVNQYNADWICSWIESQLAADVAPVVHGEWLDCENHNDIEQCSVCGMIYRYPSIYKYNFCPNCGAKMDGGESA